MHGKNSKRQRNHKAAQSLKSKQQAPRLDALDLLQEDPQEVSHAEEGVDLGSNALILPAGKAAAGSSKGSGANSEQPQQQLSKSQLKKLKQVQLKKERREQLSQVLTQLHSSSLPEEQLSLLRPLHQRGAKETKKQRLRRALQLQRAGITGVEGTDELLQERKVKGLVGSDSSNSSSESESETDKCERPAKQARTELAATAAAGGPATAGPAAGTAGSPEALSDGKAAAVPDDTQQQQQQQEDAAGTAAAAAADVKEQLRALRAEAAAIKKQARLEATGTAEDEMEAEEAAAARAAAAERAAAAAGGPTRFVSIVRPPEMEEARRQLPIIGLEQEIMESIGRHDVIVLCGETGCGKTTQVPQFLMEAGYGCSDFPERSGAVVVTQPRRVAAISTAERVASELGVKLGSTVGYQVRHDRRVGADSAVRFMTDGVLMRQLQSDFLLRSYSVILLDEAHERSLNTDLLLGMLSRLVPLRCRLHEQWLAAGQPPASEAAGAMGPIYPLKLIIMSATLRTSDFTENKRLFGKPPPVLSVPARQFPVTIHFAKHTELRDYLGTAVRKVCRIHRELPGGGILLFVTGQREVQVAVRRIRQAFARSARGVDAAARKAGGSSAAAETGSDSGVPAAAAATAAGVTDDNDDGAAAGADAAEIAADAADAAMEQDLLDAAAGDAAAAAMDDFDQLEQDEDEEEVHVVGGEGWTPEDLAAAEAQFEAKYGLSLNPRGSEDSQNPVAAAGVSAPVPGQQRAAAPVHVLPLYAMLPQAQQAAVFQPVPPGHRLIVVATNVAETSITIPGIRYVVDAGRSKQKLLESNSGAAVARYAVDWVSKAAAEQRAGRAGRTGPGHVYRLYSSAHFNDNFKQHTDPEIANTPLEGVVLLLKAMGVDKVFNFPFPSPPEPEALRTATRCLLALSALSPEPQTMQPKPQHGSAAVTTGKLTPLGRAMAVFPITPRHSRMLLQLAVWQQRQQQPQQQLASSSDSSSLGQQQQQQQLVDFGLGPTGGVSAMAAVKALPYALALAAALSLESPFMHIDSLQSEMESAAAAKERAAAGDDEDDEGAAVAAANAAAAAAAKAENQRKAQAASAAHARFRSSHGDAISSLNVLCAYEAAAAAGDAEEFCARNFLHARHLREMSQLRQQLGRTLLQLQQQQQQQQQDDTQPAGLMHMPSLRDGSSSSSEQRSALQLLQLLMAAVGQLGPQKFMEPLEQPSARVLEVLRRGLAAGWCDQVSRRVRSADYISRLVREGRRSRHAVRYSPACLAEEVYLHPRSGLASTAPEFVVYGDIVRTAKRPYMALVTAVEPQWLADCGSSLCTVSEPLSEPAPFYQPETDCVLAWHDAAYSQHAWPLPRLLLPHRDPTVRAAVFAAAMLGGKVLPALAGLAGVLVAPAATAARQELQGLPRVGELLAALQREQVYSRASLAAVWARQPDFLKQQLALWVQQRQRHVLDSLWPQLLQQATTAAVQQDSRLAGSGKRAAASGSAARQGVKQKKSKNGSKH